MIALSVVFLAACSTSAEPQVSNPAPTHGDEDVVDSTVLTDTAPTEHLVVVTDAAPGSGLDRIDGGERTRAIVAADFDNDGLDDVFMGNPGDTSYIVRNVSTPGEPKFEMVQVLSEGHLSWTAAAADYDNDGDIDLMVGGGGNECLEVDQLWQNQLMETGTLSFVDVRIEAGLTIQGGNGDAPYDQLATTGVRWADFDNDGLLDLYTTHNDKPTCAKRRAPKGVTNQLWHNEGGTFVNITLESGILHKGDSTRHPAVFDYDQDGDLDIFNSNYRSSSRFIQNLFVETGELQFADATAGLAERGADFAIEDQAFASCTADLNNDGYEDLVIFNRPTAECSAVDEDEPVTPSSVRLHSVYQNIDGTHFDDLTEEAQLQIVVKDLKGGVMGCQLGDINGDGAIDVFTGNGGPRFAAPNDLWMGTPDSLAFTGGSQAIRLPSTAADGQSEFRTHGTVLTDFDGDNAPDMLIGNGGPESRDDVQEPTQLLMFELDDDTTFFTLRLAGDGEHVNRDAIGARAELVLTDPDGTQRSIYRWMSGASCFSADNGRAMSFGLAGSTPLEVRITWPDGVATTMPIEDGAERLTVAYPAAE